MPVKTLRLFLNPGVVAVAAVAAACGSSSPSAPAAPVIQKATTASGDGQTGTVATALSNPLRVLVTLSGSPHQGDNVTWAAAGTGASVNPTTSVTDATGIATTTWTLGQTAGTQTASAALIGAAGSPVTFTATATPSTATRLSLSSGDGQTGPVNAALANPLKVKAADQFGNGVSGVGATWQVTSGSATVNPTSSTSDATGIAQTTVMLGGTTGPITITATSTGLTGSPVTFHGTATTLPMSAAVTVGPAISFTSDRNGSSNPAVDTIAVGGKVTWTWAANSIQHSVQSTGSPSFTSSAIMTTGSYSFTFMTAGTYDYDCVVHGASMNGIVVVR